MAVLQTSHQATTLLSRCLPALSTQLAQSRAYRPEVLKRTIEKIKQDKKPLYRVVEETFGFEQGVKQPPKIKFPHTHPKFFKRVSLDADNPHYHEQKAYIFTHYVHLEEDVKQALWLTKSALVGDGKMPSQVQNLGESVDIPNLDVKLEECVRQCRQYDTTDRIVKADRFSYTQILALIRLCNLLGTQYPEVINRVQAINYYVGASWTRENSVIQVRGRPGILLAAKRPLQPLAGNDEIELTTQHTLESSYPLAPTIDLKTTNVYKENYNFSGFQEGDLFPHAHTVFVHDPYRTPKFADKTNARGIMFAFANAVSRAKLQYGYEEMDLPTPIVTQCIVTNGVLFSFIHVQLNTLRLNSSDGPKNMVWMDANCALYNDMYPPDMKIYRRKGNKKTLKGYSRPLVRRDPEYGCQELDVNVFKKFLGCYLNGAFN